MSDSPSTGSPMTTAPRDGAEILTREDAMTVHELRQRLADLPDDMLVGAYSQDDELREVQTAGVFSHHATGEQVFIIRANGGFPLIGEAE